MSESSADAPLESWFQRFDVGDRVLSNILIDAAQRHGSRKFADLPGGCLRFDQLPEFASRAAAALARAGADQETPIAIVTGSRLELMAAVWGQGWIGGVAAVINPGHRGEVLTYILNHCQASVVVTDSERVVELSRLADQLPHVRTVVVVGDNEYPVWDGPGFARWDDLLAEVEPIAPANVGFSAPLMLMYTSGTTGRSKGVLMSHHHYLCFAAQTVDSLRWGHEDHLYTPMPLYHSQAHNVVVVGALLSGARATVRQHFSVSSFWLDAAACGATHGFLVGAPANMLLRHPPEPSDTAHRLKWIMCAPGPSDPVEFERRFNVQLSTRSYGLTEANPIPRSVERIDKPPECVGKPGPLYQVEVVDDDDLAVQHDGQYVGEIVLRPTLPYVMLSEYYRSPEATAAAFRNLWFHTGDLGSIDTDGYLYLRGRTKDVIRCRGENVSAVELESVVLRHPSVTLAAAFGIKSEFGEEDIKVDVLIKEDADLDGPTLIEWLRPRVAFFMLPRYIQFRSQLPMTSSLRVQKYLLREEGATGADYDRGDRNEPKTA